MKNILYTIIYIYAPLKQQLFDSEQELFLVVLVYFMLKSDSLIYFINKIIRQEERVTICVG